MIKDGGPTRDNLEGLSRKLGNYWEALARRLEFDDAEIIAFRKESEEYAEKALRMLFQWKTKKASEATFRVLYNALCHEFVNRKDLAEDFCLSDN